MHHHNFADRSLSPVSASSRASSPVLETSPSGGGASYSHAVAAATIARRESFVSVASDASSSSSTYSTSPPPPNSRDARLARRGSLSPADVHPTTPTMTTTPRQRRISATSPILRTALRASMTPGSPASLAAAAATRSVSPGAWPARTPTSSAQVSAHTRHAAARVRGTPLAQWAAAARDVLGSATAHLVTLLLALLILAAIGVSRAVAWAVAVVLAPVRVISWPGNNANHPTMDSAKSATDEFGCHDATTGGGSPGAAGGEVRGWGRWRRWLRPRRRIM
ncbi:hypothetical protein BC828DRAFT_24199 [Blastocladiella britannica]|nr:hypothetical protein BC828DRAFT_24199 [Blastocladiella britannica]